MNKYLTKIKDHSLFQISVTTVILFSSLMVGISTYDFEGTFVRVLIISDIFVTVFFVIEISIRFFSEKNKLNFFKDGWNIFDSVIVISSLIPAGAGSSVMVLRLLRLARLLRVISFIPELRFVIEALIESLKKSVYVLILIFILLYIYGVAGVILFESVEGGRFESLGEAIITLIQIMTLSSWETVMLPIVEIYPMSWMYFISFVVLSSIIVLNLFVAILVDVVSERRKRLEQESLNKNK
ncbi:MAG: cation transporter [Gammaproteobacteria bacterium TMED226]|jgi:voltage-gated sodium channel|nr:MAG: cation transporter [Gammaproteobacteria bacterium TMED226]|tara:strand:- start:3988 stop:4707 length:720 start_codon:yes stop_codon:yes gene_type:complete